MINKVTRSLTITCQLCKAKNEFIFDQERIEDLYKKTGYPCKFCGAKQRIFGLTIEHTIENIRKFENHMIEFLDNEDWNSDTRNKTEKKL